MDPKRITAIVADSLAELHRGGRLAFAPPSAPAPDLSLDDLGLDDANIGAFSQALRRRLGGSAVNVELLYRMQKAMQGSPADMHRYETLWDMVRHIRESLHHGAENPMVVYVDDEEENLFVFRRQFGSRLNLRTFQDPREALEFLQNSPEVVLVVTDEVMPGMSGNQLCDAARTTRPSLKFILLTGNPAGDENLLHRSLRQDRFYDYFSKPLDLENRKEEYFAVMNRVVSGDVL